MSLVNDALRRTKQAEQQALPPVAPGQQLPPREPAPLPPRGPGLLRFGAAGAAGLLALALIWYELRSHGLPPPAATTPAAKPVAASGEPARPPRNGKDLAAADAESPLPGPKLPERAGETKALDATNASSPQIPTPAGPGSATNALPAASAEPAPPGPTTVRLQAIIFDPIKPSAMINGRTLFIGDMFGEMRLVAIDRQSATLVGAGQTNLLTLR